jgi:hypothetical protein
MPYVLHPRESCKFLGNWHKIPERYPHLFIALLFFQPTGIFFWILNSWFLSGLNMQMKMRNMGNKLKEHHWLDSRERLSNHWLLKKRKIAEKIIPRFLQPIYKRRTSPIQLVVFKMQVAQFTNSCQSGNRSNVLEMWNTITTIISYKLAKCTEDN